MLSKKFLVSLFLVALSAAGFSECLDCVSFSVGGEAIWWQPCNEPFHYGEFANPGVLDKQLSLEPEHEWGFRVFGTIGDNNYCRFIDVEWAHVKGTTKETKTDGTEPIVLTAFPFTQTTEGGASDSITATQRTRYDKVSGRAAARFCGGQRTFIYGYLGGRWVRFEVEQISERSPQETDPEVTRVEWCTEFNAGAVEAGIGASSTLFSCLDASIRFGGIAAMGKRDHDYQRTNSDIRNNTYSNNLCTGGFELRGDLGFRVRCRCWWLRVVGGYELDYYFKTLLRPQPTIQSVNVIAEDFAIGGPVVGLTLGF